MIRHLSTAGLLLAMLLPLSSVRAQQEGAEAKLRENLRAVMLQLRNSETERATIQASMVDLEARSKELAAELESLKKEAAANQEESVKSIETLKGKVDERDKEIGGLRVTLDKWTTDHGKILKIAQMKEAQRAELASKVILLDRRVADQQRRNASMHKLGVEILDRYEKFGLGQALTSREPFVGLTRVKFENLMQDYSDQLADERIKPEPAPPAKKQASAEKTPAKSKAR